MNRVVKFRGISVKEKKFITGSLSFLFNNELNPLIMPNSYFSTRHLGEYDEDDEEIINENEMAIGGFIPVVPETVGQFTGLKDKNGVEIYEGDIIKFQLFSNWDDDKMERHTAIVHFEQGCFMWKIKKEGRQSNFHHARINDALKKTCSTWGLEVIGNIHETPELLNNPNT